MLTHSTDFLWVGSKIEICVCLNIENRVLTCCPCVCRERIFVWMCASVFAGTYVRVCVCVCGYVCTRRALASCAVSRFRKVMMWVCRVRGVRSERKRQLSLWYSLCVMCHIEIVVCHLSHVTLCVSCLITLDCFFSFFFLGGVYFVWRRTRGPLILFAHKVHTAHASHASTDSFILSSLTCISDAH
jgi:hypothetical protein